MMSALEMTYFGALVHAGSGVVTYHQIADRLSYVVGLILGNGRSRSKPSPFHVFGPF